MQMKSIKLKINYKIYAFFISHFYLGESKKMLQICAIILKKDIYS